MEKSELRPAQMNSKGINKLEKLNWKICHERKLKKVVVTVENNQITEK